MKFEVILGRIFLSLISIGATLWLVELASRPLLPTRAPIEQRFPGEIFRQPQPYVMFGGTANAEFEVELANGEIVTETLNSLGYRGPAPVSPKPAGEYRIFMLGGSTVFLGAPPLPVLLEDEFRRNGFEQVRVYNFGVISSVSSMELTRLVLEISELEPNLIVMYNGGNDIIGPYRHDPRPGYPFNFLVYENNPLVENEVDSYPATALWLYGSNLARYFFPNYFLTGFADFDHLRQRTDWGSDAWRDKTAAIYVENLVKAHRVARAFGAEFVAFPQPLVYYKDTVAAEENDQAYHGERRAYALDMRERIREQLKAAYLADPTLKVIDLTDVYDGTAGWVFTDAIHTRQESKGVVVQAIYHALAEYSRQKILAVSEAE